MAADSSLGARAELPASQIWLAPSTAAVVGTLCCARRRRASAARVAVRSGGQRCTKLLKPH